MLNITIMEYEDCLRELQGRTAETSRESKNPLSHTIAKHFRNYLNILMFSY